jgi:hypothetical protein
VLDGDGPGHEQTWLVIFFFLSQMSLGTLGFVMTQLGFMTLLAAVGAFHGGAGSFGSVPP